MLLVVTASFVHVTLRKIQGSKAVNMPAQHGNLLLQITALRLRLTAPHASNLEPAPPSARAHH